MTSNKFDAGTVLSLIISAASIGFASATISSDYDVEPSRRLAYPEVYGIMPDVGRSQALFCMFIMSTFHVLMKAIACSLMILVSKSLFLIYILSDMGLFFGFKAVLGNLTYWLPLEGWASVLVSGISRFVVKSVTDFTLIVQFRHQNELGGRYWTCNMIMQQAFSFVAVFLYRSKYTTSGCAIAEKEAVEDASNVTVAFDANSFGNVTFFGNVSTGCNSTIDSLFGNVTATNSTFDSYEPLAGLNSTTNSSVGLYGIGETAMDCSGEGGVVPALLYIVGGCFLASMLAFHLFLNRIPKKYRKTFLDNRTAKEFCCDAWRAESNDKRRFAILNIHRSYYRSIDGEIKTWLHTNWETWEKEDNWFNAKLIRQIPEELLPTGVLQKLGGAVGRRESLDAMEKIEKAAKLEKKKKAKEDKATLPV